MTHCVVNEEDTMIYQGTLVDCEDRAAYELFLSDGDKLEIKRRVMTVRAFLANKKANRSNFND